MGRRHGAIPSNEVWPAASPGTEWPSGGSATGMTTVETVTALKAATGVSNSEYRFVMGYHTNGDGGGGIFKRDTALASFDEGMTVDHNTEAGGWKRIIPLDYLIRNVKWFGAKGDNTQTGQQLYFQRAIDSLPSTGSTGQGGKVVVPAGIYLFDGGVTVSDSQTMLIIEGQGASAQFATGVNTLPGPTIKITASDVVAFKFRSNTVSSVRLYGPEIRNMVFRDASGASSGPGFSATGLWFNAICRWTVTRCHFEHMQYGILNMSRQTGDTDTTQVYGERWAASTFYRKGQMVRPTTGSNAVTGYGYVYQAANDGTSAASEPTWSVTIGATLTDNTVTWNVIADPLPGGDASWNNVHNSTFIRNRIGYYAPQGGGTEFTGRCNITNWRSSDTSWNPTAADGVNDYDQIGFWFGGGAQHRVSGMKCDRGIAIRMAGSNSLIDHNQFENCSQAVILEDNGGVASGDLFSGDHNKFYGTGTTAWTWINAAGCGNNIIDHNTYGSGVTPVSNAPADLVRTPTGTG